MHRQSGEHVFEQDQDPVAREERLGDREPPVGRVVERSLEPLGRRRHRRVERKSDDVPGQAADALGAHRVALVGHRGGADLGCLERLLDLAVVLKEAQIRADLVGRLGEARERLDDPIVLLARVGLARDDLAAFEPGAARDRAVELLDLRRIAVEEEKKGRLRAGRALRSQETQLFPAAPDLLEVRQEVERPERDPLADRRGLRGLVVGVGERRGRAVLARERPHPAKHGDESPLDDSERFAHDDQIRVVGDVGGGRAPVDDPARGRRGLAEDANVRHDVVAGALLFPRRRVEIDVGQVRAHLPDRLLRDRKAESPFLLGEPQPEESPRLELAPAREEAGHLFGRVPPGEGVRVRISLRHRPTRRP